MKYICFLIPALISLDYSKKNRKEPVELILEYGKYCALVNILVLLILMFMGKGKQLLDEHFTITFYCFYLLVGLFLAFCLPRIFDYCSKNMSFKVKRVNNEKK